MFKISDKARKLIVASIGLLFILFGILQACGLSVDNKIVDNVSFALMMLALVFFFGGRRSKTNTKESENKALEEKNTEKTDDEKDNSGNA